jgi:hypothetical protein
MIECLAKPLDGAMQPRQHAGLGAGSQSAFQRLVGRCRQPVQKPDERMDSVQAGPARGVSPMAAGLSRMRQHVRRRPALGDAPGIATPCPPPPHRSDGGQPRNFPLFFPRKLDLPFFFMCRTITKRSFCNAR